MVGSSSSHRTAPLRLHFFCVANVNFRLTKYVISLTDSRGGTEVAYQSDADRRRRAVGALLAPVLQDRSLVVRANDLLEATMHTLTGRVLAVVALCMIVFVPKQLSARDDGRFANSPLKQWFDRLASGKGLCCSFADGVSVEDVDWDTQGGRYRVRLNGQWLQVPDAALVTEPNRFGPAVVWPYQDTEGVTQIRCFLPGAGA
jgi:hypothetical protein